MADVDEPVLRGLRVLSPMEQFRPILMRALSTPPRPRQESFTPGQRSVISPTDMVPSRLSIRSVPRTDTRARRSKLRHETTYPRAKRRAAEAT